MIIAKKKLTNQNKKGGYPEEGSHEILAKSTLKARMKEIKKRGMN